MNFDWSVIWAALPNLLDGTVMTVKITFWGLLGGFALGALAGVTRAYAPSAATVTIEGMTFWGALGGLLRNDDAHAARACLARYLRAALARVLACIAVLYVAVIRGTPIIVQVMFIYFALPLIAQGLRIDAQLAAILTLMINSGAYIAEIVRGALLSVPRGLKEAGQAMGLPFYKILTHIIGPVAVRRMIPPMGNQCIISLKDSSLFIVIGVAELTRQGQEIMASNFRAVEIWSAVAVIYLIITGMMAVGLRIAEKRMRIL